MYNTTMLTQKQPYAVTVTTHNQERTSADEALLAGLGSQFDRQQYFYAPLELNTHTRNNNNGTCTNMTQQTMPYGVSRYRYWQCS